MAGSAAVTGDEGGPRLSAIEAGVEECGYHCQASGFRGISVPLKRRPSRRTGMKPPGLRRHPGKPMP